MSFNRTSIRFAAVCSFGLTGILLSFQNCQRPVQDLQGGRAPAAEESSGITLYHPTEFSTPLEAAEAPFASGKIQIRLPDQNPSGGVSGKMSAAQVSSEQPLLIVLNNLCADETPGPLSGRISREGRLDLEAQVYPWNLPSDLPVAELQAAADADPCVIGISHDDVVRATAAPNDASLSQQVHFTAIGGPESFDFFNDSLRGSTSPIVFAVIDSGIARSHEDLKNMLGTDSSGNNGRNFYSGGNFVEDDFGHGTAVAGLIAAQANNSVGMAGVMGHHAKVMSLKVQNNQGDSTVSLMVSAIQYAASEKADVINISMEGAGHNASLQSALQNAVASGSVVVVAAGNGGVQISSTNYVVPAAYGSSISGMITVGAIDSYSGAKSSFSNYGTSYVEIAAPGSNGVYYPNYKGGYKTGQGTSYSSPLVAGAAGLVISFLKKNGISYTPATVEAILNNAAVSRSGLTSSFTSGRTLDLRSLSQYLRRNFLATVDGGFDEN